MCLSSVLWITTRSCWLLPTSRRAHCCYTYVSPAPAFARPIPSLPLPRQRQLLNYALRKHRPPQPLCQPGHIIWKRQHKMFSFSSFSHCCCCCFAGGCCCCVFRTVSAFSGRIHIMQINVCLWFRLQTVAIYIHFLSLKIPKGNQKLCNLKKTSHYRDSFALFTRQLPNVAWNYLVCKGNCLSAITVFIDTPNVFIRVQGF